MERLEVSDAKQLGLTIRMMRKRQGVTRDELADFSGLHRNSIAKVELGLTDVKLSTLIRIADLLGLRVILENEGT